MKNKFIEYKYLFRPIIFKIEIKINKPTDENLTNIQSLQSYLYKNK
jgi:hypothetical protein